MFPSPGFPAASNVSGAPSRTASSANPAWPMFALWNTPIASSQPSCPTSSAASQWPRRNPFPTSARSRAVSIWLAAAAFATSASSPPAHTVAWSREIFQLPPASATPCFAGKTVESSHQLDGSLRFYLGPSLLLTAQRPLRELEEPRPATLTSALKRKPKMPRIYNLGGRPALAATS